MPQTYSTLASLSCSIFQKEAIPPELIVVLCHGFGAPGDDLAMLGEELVRLRPALGARVRFVFPQAPLTLESLGMGGGARAWWMLDMERMMMRQQGGDEASMVEQLRKEQPAGLPTARRLLMGLVSELSQQTRLPVSRIVLGGFSQGAMLATDVALRLEEAPAALCVFSGALICEEDWRQRASKRQGLKVLQSHGHDDLLLPFESAEALRDLLTGAGLSVDFLPFDGGHTLTVPGLERLGALLEGLLAKR